MTIKGKRGMARVTRPRQFFGVMIIAPKNAKATDFKFGVHAPRDSREMTHGKNFQNRGVVRVT